MPPPTITQMPAKLDDPFALAKRLHQSGDLAAAEAAYRDLLKRSPRHAEAVRLLGHLCHQTNRFDEAEKHLLAATQLAPRSGSARYCLALLRMSQARTEDAITCLRTTLRIDSKLHDAHLKLADLLADRANDAAAALPHYEAAAKLKPAHAATWCNYGAVLRRLGRPRDAVAALQRALDAQPDLIQAHTNLVDGCLESGLLNDALAASQRFLKLQPTSGRAHESAARALRQAGELDMAREHLRIAITLEPRNLEYVNQLAELLSDRSAFAESDALYAQAIRIDADSADAAIGLLVNLHRQGNRDEAISAAQDLLRRFASNPAAICSAATVLRENSEPHAAAEALSPLVDRDELPARVRRTVLFEYGHCLDKLDRCDEAWPIFVRANEARGAMYDQTSALAAFERIQSAFSERAPRASVGARFIFIVGMPRSGTSLVEQILDSHPDVTGTGETGIVNRIIGRIHALTGRTEPYPQWTAGLTEQDVRTLAAFAWNEMHKSSVAHASSPVIGVSASTAEESIMAEKTPTHFMHLGLLAKLFPDAKFIWCRRDAMDVCLSCYIRDFAGDYPWCYDLDNLAFMFRLHERYMQHWQSVFDDGRILETRYESIVEHPREAIAKMLDHAGVPWDDACLNFHENPRAVRTASAEQVRRPLYKSAIAAHKRYARHLEPLRDALRR